MKGSDSDRLTDVIEATLSSLWKAVDDLASVHPHNPSGDYRVSIFGSARVQPGAPAYESVKHLARRLAEQGIIVISGGGPGLMQAANEGERLGDPGSLHKSIGIRIELPFEQGVNPFVEEAYHHRTFFSRLHHFVRLTNAFVVMDGGIGTTLESLMIWQLLQVRQIADVPLIFVGPMWQDLVAWARKGMLEGRATPLISPRDLEIPVCVDTTEQAATLIEAHAREWRAKFLAKASGIEK